MTFVKSLIQKFEANYNDENAKAMAAYLKNKFLHYGLKKPLRAEIIKAFVEEHDLPKGEELKKVVRELWKEKHRESHHAAMDLMELQVKKLDETFLAFFEELLPQNAWWDTVDVLSPRLTGRLLKRFPHLIEQYPKRWIRIDNFWMQRAAILFQLKYREQTDADLLFEFILEVADSKEFFLQKAAGWSLRQYGRYNPEAVRHFIANHTLSKLTVREGSKYI